MVIQMLAIQSLVIDRSRDTCFMCHHLDGFGATDAGYNPSPLKGKDWKQDIPNWNLEVVFLLKVFS